ncbi:hypothetical protein [Pasteuria penetrans]|uniref:hypothetical protein n=1 Tax=Pasteuria penetrans TaxID=86005 RepID=UPI0011F049BC|nr:hypothetical protein [Pasteuria penetrans]
MLLGPTYDHLLISDCTLAGPAGPPAPSSLQGFHHYCELIRALFTEALVYPLISPFLALSGFVRQFLVVLPYEEGLNQGPSFCVPDVSRMVSGSFLYVPYGLVPRIGLSSVLWFPSAHSCHHGYSYFSVKALIIPKGGSILRSFAYRCNNLI